MKIKNLILCSILILPLLAIAETLSLDDCIGRALKESEKIRAAELTVKKAEDDRDSTFWRYFPSATIEFKYLFLEYCPEAESLDLAFSEAYEPRKEILDQIREGIVSGLPGGTVPPGMEDALEETVRQMAKSSLSAYDTTISLPDKSRTLEIKAVQPITPLWSVYKGHHAKHLTVEIEKLKAQLTKDSTTGKMTDFYYTYNMLSEIEKLLDETEAQLKRYREKAQTFVDAGLSDKRSVLKIEIEIAKVAREKQEITGKKNVVKTAISLLINIDIDDFSLEKPSDMDISFQKSLVELYEIQNERRKEFKILNLYDEVKDDLRSVAIQPLIPTLALTAGYKRDWDSNILMPEGTFFFGGVATWNIGFDLISNLKSYSLAKKDKIITKLKNIDSKKSMQLQTAKLHSDILVIEKDIEISESQISASEENVRIEEEKYGEKLTTETDLLSARLTLTKAKTSYISNRYKYIISIHNISTLLGVDVDDLTLK